MSEMDGCAVYISKPSTMKDPSSAIVIAPDVFGIRLLNNKLICDKFAEAMGCMVVLVVSNVIMTKLLIYLFLFSIILFYFILFLLFILCYLFNFDQEYFGGNKSISSIA
jgi:hypothetical protein